MSIREALMEMAKPKTERAEWVPESILDDDVSHFMGAAAAAKKAGKPHFDFGGKKYKVTMKHDTAKKVDESAESCPECGADGECQCEQPVEEAKVDELSKGTLDRYRQVAYNDRIRQSGNRQKGEDDTPGMKKRDAGIALATKKSNAKGPGFEPKSRPGGDVLKFKSKKESVEEAVSVKKQDYKWGRMMTVHHGKSHSYPLHPEHQSAIKKLGDNQKTSFKDETGTKVTAHRQGDTVHLSSSKTNAKTPVAHSHFTESVNEAAGTAQHRPTKATSDTFDKQMNNGEGGIPMGKKKDFVNMHNMEVALDAEEIYKKNKYEALSKTPARPGDQTAGDTKPVNPIPANPIDGMRAALAKMKLSGE